MSTSEGNRQLEAVRWERSVAVQESLHSKLTAVEMRNKDLEVAAARLFQELDGITTDGSSTLEARLSKGEQMLASINEALTDLENARDDEVAMLQESLETCQAETRRLRFEQEAERRETAELLAELAAGEEASAELLSSKLQEIENLHCDLRRSQDEHAHLRDEQAKERQEHAGLVSELAGDAEHSARMHAGSLREIEHLQQILRRERDERQRLIMGELSELTNAKARLQQLVAEKQQLLAVRSLEQDAHSSELKKLHTAHAAEVAELRRALAASESERERLADIVRRQHEDVERATVLQEQRSSSTNTKSFKAKNGSVNGNTDTAATDEQGLLVSKTIGKQASIIVALREQLEADKAAALKDKQIAVEKVRSKAKALIRANGTERRKAEAQIAELKTQLQQRDQIAPGWDH